jgi:hypothetical protein
MFVSCQALITTEQCCQLAAFPFCLDITTYKLFGDYAILASSFGLAPVEKITCNSKGETNRSRKRALWRSSYKRHDVALGGTGTRTRAGRPVAEFKVFPEPFMTHDLMGADGPSFVLRLAWVVHCNKLYNCKVSLICPLE